jgi:hypothetical protein
MERNSGSLGLNEINGEKSKHLQGIAEDFIKERLQLIAVPKAGTKIFCFGIFSKNSRYLSQFFTDSHEN